MFSIKTLTIVRITINQYVDKLSRSTLEILTIESNEKYISISIRAHSGRLQRNAFIEYCL